MLPLIPVGVEIAIEVGKIALPALLSYLKQHGVTDAQIDEMYEISKQGMLARDPANIPD